MAKGKGRRQERAEQRSSVAPAPVDPFERARPWLLGAAAALLVARPLIPGVNVEFQGGDAPFVLLWLLLAVAALFCAWRSGTVPLRFAAVDKAFALLIALHGASALVALWSDCAPRPAINMLWTWVAYGAAFAVVRQLLRWPAEARAVAAVMIALSVAECGYALHDYFIAQPEVRAEYLRDPDAALRSIGQWYPPGSRERALFEDRLASTEPVGTFALTNSLAGLLVAWFVVVVGAALTLPARYERRVATWLVLAAIAGLIGVVLLLTKSRSAVIGAVVGLGALVASRVGRKFVGRRTAVALALVAVPLLVGVALLGNLDREVIFEAPKSLSYRFEYWNATWRMIYESPWLGCGPGEFKDTYSRFKLPTASEEISDPHNFLLEVWSTAGTASAAALLVLLGCVVWSVVRSKSAHDAATVAETPSTAPRDAVLAILVGGLWGWIVAYVLPFFAGPAIEVPLSGEALVGGLLLAGATLFALRPWVRRGELPAVVPLAATIALLVNLSAAGGISHPGVAQTLWLLTLLVVTLAEGNWQPSERRLGSTGLAVGLVATLLIAAAATVSLYVPVVRSQFEIAAAAGEPQRAEEHLSAATEADPFGFEAWRQLALLRFELWRREPSPERLAAFELAAKEWLARRPSASEAWGAWGAWHSIVFETTKDPAHAKQAVEAWQRAVELYPSSARRWARLSLAASAAGDDETSARAAAEALRLDRLTPHEDQKLEPELREQMLERSDGDEPDVP